MVTYRQPFKGYYPITQEYGVIIPGVTYKGRPHSGIDYGCPDGTEILASADGIVRRSDFEATGYGKYIIIEHEGGKATLYAHLSGRNVSEGMRVKQGDIIGFSGNTGNSTGPHLHFEARKVWNDWKSHQNPITFLPMMTVDDTIVANSQTNMTTATIMRKNEQKINGGLCEVVCDEANIRDAENYLIYGRLFRGAKIVISPDVVMFNNLPYHKFCDDYMLIAEYDGYGTEIIRKIAD